MFDLDLMERERERKREQKRKTREYYGLEINLFTRLIFRRQKFKIIQL